MTLAGGLNESRINDRLRLLSGLDQLRREVDANDLMGTTDVFKMLFTIVRGIIADRQKVAVKVARWALDGQGARTTQLRERKDW